MILALAYFSIGVLLYGALLKPLKAPRVKRTFLLLLPIVSVALAYVPFQFQVTNPAVVGLLPEVSVGEQLTSVSSGFWISVEGVVFGIWLLGALISFGFFGKEIAKLVSVIKAGEWMDREEGLLVNQQVEGPFSFLRWIIVPSKETTSLVIDHEKAHRRKLHSLDVLFFRAIQAALWWNPLAYIAKHWAMENHEQEIDSEISQDNVLEYAHVLKYEALKSWKFQLAPSFSTKSQLKQRLVMLNKAKQTQRGWFNAFGVMALVFGLVVMVNTSCDQQQKEVEEEVLTDLKSLETMPEYEGGQKALFTYLGNSIKYPESMKADSVEGTSFISFVISAEGKVEDVKVVKSLHTDADAEAMRVIGEMGSWIPGMKEGKAVAVQYTLPIRFVLQ